MITQPRKKILERQGYRLVGEHSGTKTCHYCKQGIRGKDVCYKNTFYGIKSWGCIQASVSIDVCNLKCQWCWRDINYTTNALEQFDEPSSIVDGLIEQHLQLLKGFYGSDAVDKERLGESAKPKHVALSLTGEVCLYPKLPELIDEIHRREMTTFVVSNGTMPGMLRKLLHGHEPTQMYITLPAPDKDTYEKMCNPLIADGWEKILESLALLGKFKRGTVRLTLAKDMNMHDAERYAELLKDSGWKFLEIKSVVAVGDAASRVERENMPSHCEIKEFAAAICKCYGWRIIAEKEESRVVLVMREDFDGRIMGFD